MGAMPQLDFSTFPSQLFWFFVVFLAIYLVVAIFIVPQIESIIRSRGLAIHSALEEAATLCMLSAEEVERKKVAIQRAEQKASKIIDDAIAKMEELRYNATLLLDDEISGLIVMARGKMDEMKRDAITSVKLRQGVAELALMYYNKLLGTDCRELSGLDEHVVDLLMKGKW